MLTRKLAPTTRHSPRLTLVITADEVAAIDDWRSRHQIWSRSEAIRLLAAECLAYVANEQLKDTAA
jgi:hypothetical protein